MCGSFNQTGSDGSSSIDSDEELCIINMKAGKLHMLEMR